MGAAPHNWLLTLRVEVAKQKLRDGKLSLRDVALACGFADQSHLTQVFTRSVGVSPGAWRPTDRHFFVNGTPSLHGRFRPAAPFRLSLEHKRDLLKRRAHKKPYSPCK
jgi:AraC-like DNA-binding protein